MGLGAATLAAITAATSVTATVVGITQNRQAQKAQKRAGMIQAAQNKQQEMEERRRQIREERIKRARVAQSSVNTGTQGSSGEFGAVSGLATNLSSNVGQNLSSVFLGGELGRAAQDSATAQGNARVASAVGQLAPTAINLGASIFSTNTPQYDPLGDFLTDPTLYQK